MKYNKISSRGQRIQHFKKLHGKAGLNLVSLMDIFTILVFFLLVSSSNVQQLPNNKQISLPASIAKKVPKETIIIAITKTEILLQGKKIGDIEEIMSSNQRVIKKLEEDLKYYSSNIAGIQIATQDAKSVTIMGDENIPYQLLRIILATCREANYNHIAFAAVQKAKDKS